MGHQKTGKTDRPYLFLHVWLFLDGRCLRSSVVIRMTA
jgi:hypothetical protein